LTARPDVVIVGGGIIGCSLAFHLARRGARVVLVERGRIGTQASAAAAGLLVPLAEARGPDAFLDLALESLRRYPGFAEELGDLSGVDVELVPTALLRVALDGAESAELHRRLAWQLALAPGAVWLDAAQVRGYEPAVGPEVIGALYYPDALHVSAPRVVAALARAAARAGAELREGVEATGFLHERARVTGVRLADGTLSAGHVVIASGAWAARAGGWLNFSLPVFPVRGQIVALRALPAPITHILFSAIGYLVAKPDGTVLVGATEEDAGFAADVTAAGLAALLAAVARLVPGLQAAPFVRAWAGLRPGSPDRLPLLGPLPGWSQISVASGHFRNGILLAPATGALMAEAILSGGLPDRLRPFDPGRFATAGTL